MLKLSNTRDGDTAHVHAAGELEISTAPDLSDQLDGLIDGGVRSVTLDLSEITFLDSTGLSAILGAHQKLEALGGQLVLEGPSASITRLFDITGLNEHFVIRLPKS